MSDFGVADSNSAARRLAQEPMVDAVTQIQLGRQDVLNFVRTPFSARRNVVKIWRSIPANIWTALSLPEDRLESLRRERLALLGVGLIATILVAGIAFIGFRADVDGSTMSFPMLGWSFSAKGDTPPSPGWYYMPGQTLSLVLWTVLPPLLGWAFVRAVWIPLIVSGRPHRESAVSFARHLSGVYFYVFLMIFAGACLMPLFVRLSPAGFEMFRWCFWCFLFGESFFVPAVMWLRLVLSDSSGQVFGQFRHGLMAAYLLGCVVIPIYGMVTELP